MDQYKADADKFEDDGHRKELGNGMALLAAAMNLNRHEENVNGKKDETLLEDVLLVVGEVVDERAVETFLERVSIHQLHVVIEPTRRAVIMFPLTSRQVAEA